MEKKPILFIATAFLAGAAGSALFSPAPVAAVAREIIELQRDVTTLLQGQRDITSSIDQKHATLKTLLDQNNAAISGFAGTIGTLQKAVQDVQANSGARLDTMATQVQGLSDNLEELKVRVGKVNQQLADLQNTLQGIDAKLAGANPSPVNPGATGTGSGPGTSGAPPSSSASSPSADTLYSNGLRDINGGKYDLARQEFQDYLKYYPETDLASNAQFYIGEIDFQQKKYDQAASAYDKVLTNYPKSYKTAPARLHRGMALIELNQKAAGIRDFREVIRRFPGTDEEKRARAKLRELGATATSSR
ncbi:MAG TPA: tol-pal system protein YbgF [Candidatus Dormibacteraeota bacterium]|nr:tol-pal system protein YbgF [Candidatus Dormibacteraeota bacterium]